MSMFLWDGGRLLVRGRGPRRAGELDGDFDADIVIHEFHHGVSHRLNTEFTGVEADAIGEGGSDFFAYSINGNTTLAEYASPPPASAQVNDKRYGNWWCLFDIICVPHDNGEIWANVLWDLRERFRGDLVEGTEAAAIRAAHLLYVDGLALSPPSPTMLDMRDAMVPADALRRPSGDPGGSVNYCRIWEVFALRGMGAAAQDTNDRATRSVVADSSMPAECPALPAPATVTIVATDARRPKPGSIRAPSPSRGRRDDRAGPDGLLRHAGGGRRRRARISWRCPGAAVIPAGDTAVTVRARAIDDLRSSNRTSR